MWRRGLIASNYGGRRGHIMRIGIPYISVGFSSHMNPGYAIRSGKAAIEAQRESEIGAATDYGIQRIARKGIVNSVDKRGQFHQSVNLKDLLNRVDLDKDMIVLVNEGGGGEAYPTVKIVDRKQHKDKEKQIKAAIRKQKKDPSNVTKTVLIGWGISDYDLQGHRKDSIVKFLSRGNKVEIALGTKANSRIRVPDKRKQEIVDFVRELCDENGLQIVQSEGSIHKSVKFMYQGRRKEDEQDNEE